MADGMLFVETEGRGSMDVYSQRLSPRLGIAVERTNIYQRSARRFGVGLMSREAIGLAGADLGFVRSLRSGAGPVHLPNQHLARYGLLAGRPYVVTVHDLIRCVDRRRRQPLIGRPNPRDRLLLALDCAGIRAAEGIVAVSETTRDDLVDELDIPPERIAVVHNGIDHEVFRPAGSPVFEFPYILFVGSEQPRKNIGALLKAMARLGDPELRLVKVGPPGSDPAYRRRTEHLISELGLGDRVVLAPWLTDMQLARVYSGARCLVVPSLYEGFGQPPLEAMACGCPVIASGNGSLAEVVGDAAVRPASGAPDDLAQAIETILRSSRLADELVARGLDRAAAFTWDRTARETTAAYARLLGTAPSPAALGPPEAVATPA